MRVEGETVMVSPRAPVVGDWGGAIGAVKNDAVTASRRREEDWFDRDSCDQRKIQQFASKMAGSPPRQRLAVGYALTSKKVKSFLQPKLEGLARVFQVPVPSKLGAPALVDSPVVFTQLLEPGFLETALFDLIPASWVARNAISVFFLVMYYAYFF